MRTFRRIVILLVIGYACVVGLFGCMQRSLLYFPSHDDVTGAAFQQGLRLWSIDGEYTGFARVVANPRKIWLVVHGNGGQAANRTYVLPHVNPGDAVYILEYPGYGMRAGRPSKASFDAAALKGYNAILKTYGVERVIVLGESLGSGPACELARAPIPPRHFVLIVPFDAIVDVARQHYPFLPVGLLMLDRWNNVEALKGYSGRLDIFGGTYDPVIPVQHARSLAASVPGADFHEFAGGHNWAGSAEIDLSRM